MGGGAKGTVVSVVRQMGDGPRQAALGGVLLLPSRGAEDLRGLAFNFFFLGAGGAQTLGGATAVVAALPSPFVLGRG